MTEIGVALLVIGAIVVVIESHLPSLGMIGGPGVVAMSAGAVLAVSGLGGGLVLGIIAAVVLAAAGACLLTLSLTKGAAVHRRRVRTGPEGIVGQIGVVRSWAESGGSVLLDGALWRARRSSYDEERSEQLGGLREGDSVVVERLNGLTLAVRRAEDWELVV
jgi:membrane-bound serine protease (ClpP class)